MFNQIATNFPKSRAPSGTDTEGNMSGIEIDSPRKQISVAQNFPVVINGVGELTSMWIGQRGVLEITKKKDQEEKKIAITEKSQEIQMLAVTCLEQ